MLDSCRRCVQRGELCLSVEREAREREREEEEKEDLSGGQTVRRVTGGGKQKNAHKDKPGC